MKNFGIQEPCNENWANMSPTQKGAFCQKCAKQVIDFTTKSKDSIKSTLLENKGKSLCGRMTVEQEFELQNDFSLWKQSSHQQMRRVSLYVFILVFGLSIVSCADEQDKNTINLLHQSTLQVLVDNESDDEIIVVSAEEKIDNIEGVEIPMIKEISCEVMGVIAPFEYELATEEEISVSEKIQYVTMGAMRAPNYREVQYLEETTEPTRYDDNGLAIPKEFNSLAYPNPTNSNTTLKFEVPSKVKASIMLYDMKGTLVREIENKKFEAGTHNMTVDLTDNTPGTYLIYIVSKEYRKSLRVVRIE